VSSDEGERIEPDDPGPMHTARIRRQRTTAVLLTVLVTLATSLALLAILLPDGPDTAVATAALVVLIGAPLVRVGWLVARWFRLGDVRYGLVALAVLAVAGIAIAI
jgi:multisubunit Na+/H+ antiporter MnhB subunit